MADHWDIMDPIPLWGTDGNRYHLQGATLAGGSIFVALFDNDTDSLIIYRFHPTSGWTLVTTHGSWGTAASAGLYVVGSKLFIYGDLEHWSYDFIDDVWVDDLSLPSDTFEHGGGGAIGPIIYYAGAGTTTTNKIKSYNTVTDVWDENVATIPTSVYRVKWGCFVLNGVLYFKDEDVSGNGSTPDRFTFTPGVGVATHSLDAPSASENGRMGQGTDGRFVWAVGGFYWIGSSASEHAYYYDTEDDTPSWVQVANHPQSQGTHSLIVLLLNDYIWTVGGDFDTRKFERSLCRYTPEVSPEEGWGAKD